MVEPQVAKKEVREFKSVSIRRHADAYISLPEGMTYPQAGGWLKKLAEEEDEVTNLFRKTKAHPLDGAHALAVALERLYGFVKTESVDMGFFGKRPPILIDVQTDFRSFVKVPWGEMSTPSLGDEGRITTSVQYDDNSRPVFCILAKIRKKHVAEIGRLFDLVETILAKESIYKGKALRLNLTKLDESEMNGNPLACAPKFLDLSKVDPKALRYDSLTTDVLQTEVYSRIVYADHWRKKGVNLKEGTLFHGGFGTGKSATMDAIAKTAVENGWTVGLLSDVKKIKEAYYELLSLAPAILIVEDVEKAMSGVRTPEMDAITHVMDGTESKGNEVMLIATTNEPLKINKVFIRPGRFGVCIELKRPDADTAGRLVQLYGGNDLREGFDFKVVGAILAGYTPADIRSAVETARIVAFTKDPLHGTTKVTERDVEVASQRLEAQKAFFKSAETPPSLLEEIGRAAHNRVHELVHSNGHTETQ